MNYYRQIRAFIKTMKEAGYEVYNGELIEYEKIPGIVSGYLTLSLMSEEKKVTIIVRISSNTFSQVIFLADVEVTVNDKHFKDMARVFSEYNTLYTYLINVIDNLK